MKLYELKESTDPLQRVAQWVANYWKGVDPDMTEADELREIEQVLKKGSVDELAKWAAMTKQGSDPDMVQWEMADELEQLLR